MTVSPDWIAADMTGAAPYLRAMRGAEVVAEHRGRPGEAPEPALAACGWPDVAVLAAGLPDWSAAPSVPCPAAPHLLRRPGRRVVWSATGIRQASPADLLAGEEVAIAGLLAAEPKFDGVVWVVGAISRWVRVSAGEVCFIQSVASGELAAGLGAALETGEGGTDVFDAALDAALTRPAEAWGQLYRLRAAAAFGTPDPEAGARIRGMVLGWELAATRLHWLGQRVALLARAGTGDLQARALARQGTAPDRVDYDAAMLAGLHGAQARLG